jgi:hypothetical protein
MCCADACDDHIATIASVVPLNRLSDANNVRLPSSRRAATSIGLRDLGTVPDAGGIGVTA